MDPVSLALSATQFGVGALQSVIGGSKAKKARKELENLNTPTYTPNKGINDLYNTALQRFNTSSTDTAEYRTALQMADRATSAGLTALGSRRSAVAGVSNLVARQNDATLRANIAATNEQDQRFGQVFNATQMKTADDRMAFQQNQIAPNERKYNLLAMKAKANTDVANSGISNMWGGINTAAMMYGGAGGASAGGGRVGGGGNNARYSEWDRYMNQYRGNTGNSTWNSSSALPVNDFRIP